MAMSVWLQRRLRFWGRVILASGAGALVLRMALLSRAETPDFLVDKWDTENDLPNSSVSAVAQTSDGYLWVGTGNGLARFDGMSFVTFDPGNTPELDHARIEDLFLDCTGRLWINTYRGGLTSYRNGVFQREWLGHGEFDIHTTLAVSASNRLVFVTQTGEVLERDPLRVGTNSQWKAHAPPDAARLIFFCADAQQTLWFIAREAQGQIIRLEDGEFRPLPEGSGLEGQRALTLAADDRGTVWAGTDGAVARWDGQQFQNMTPTNGESKLEATFVLPTRDGGLWVLTGEGRLRKQVGRRWVNEAGEWRGLLGWASGRTMGMHEDNEGGVWFNHYGNGLFHVTPEGDFQRFTTSEGLPGNRIGAWFQGHEGSIWLGLDRGGLARLREKRFQIVDPPSGSPAGAALSVCEDEDGTVWFGNSGGGLHRLKAGQIDTFAVGSEPSADFVFSVYPQTGQGLWLSASAGEELYVFRHGQVQRGPWDVHGIKAILADTAGRVWMGTKSGLNWWTPSARRSFGAADGMGGLPVRALAEDSAHKVWCGTDDGTLYRCEPERVQGFKPADALAGQPIWSLWADARGAIWAGTFRGGLLRFKDGLFARLTTSQGLPSDVVSAIIEDGHGDLWLGTHQGICRAPKEAIEACAEGQTRRVDFITYGRGDGLPSLECSGSYQPACWRSHDGRLWFATVKGTVSVKPEELKSNPVPPPVVIEEFRVDGEPVRLGNGRVVVPPGPKQFEFQFAALSFVAPEKARFRYQLEGLERDWVDAGTRRVAHYTHLPARNYLFRVLACNSDGVWNTKGSTVAFTVLPHFYERRWFLALEAVAIIGSVAAAVRVVTTRKYRQALVRLGQQHAIERDRARIAKDIHDDLGAGLTQITLLSELARREPPEHAAQHLDRISESARRLTKAMDEIVWAVDPQHDTLNGLLDYISAFTEDFLRAAGLRCRMDLPSDLPAAPVAAELRYNLLLALKEALNNVVKHARATEVWLRLHQQRDEVTLIIEDNGQGFSTAGNGGRSQRLASGHGLAYMAERLTAVGGHCEIVSAPGQGTRVQISLGNSKS
jgi:signal transduction histidine kinase/ligand-binding sensor domain-containing protein